MWLVTLTPPPSRCTLHSFSNSASIWVASSEYSLSSPLYSMQLLNISFMSVSNCRVNHRISGISRRNFLMCMQTVCIKPLQAPRYPCIQTVCIKPLQAPRYPCIQTVCIKPLQAPRYPCMQTVCIKPLQAPRYPCMQTVCIKPLQAPRYPCMQYSRLFHSPIITLNKVIICVCCIFSTAVHGSWQTLGFGNVWLPTQTVVVKPHVFTLVSQWSKTTSSLMGVKWSNLPRLWWSNVFSLVCSRLWSSPLAWRSARGNRGRWTQLLGPQTPSCPPDDAVHSELNRGRSYHVTTPLPHPHTQPTLVECSVQKFFFLIFHAETV